MEAGEQVEEAVPILDGGGGARPERAKEAASVVAVDTTTAVARKLQLGKKESLVDDFGAWKKVYKFYPQEFPSALAADAYTGWNNDHLAKFFDLKVEHKCPSDCCTSC